MSTDRRDTTEKKPDPPKPAGGHDSQTAADSSRPTEQSRSKHREHIATALNSGDKSDKFNGTRGYDSHIQGTNGNAGKGGGEEKSPRSSHSSVAEIAKKAQQTRDHAESKVRSPHEKVEQHTQKVDEKSPGEDQPSSQHPAKKFQTRSEHRVHMSKNLDRMDGEAKVLNPGDRSENTDENKGGGSRRNSYLQGSGDKSGSGGGDTKSLRPSYTPIAETAKKNSKQAESPKSETAAPKPFAAEKRATEHQRVTGIGRPGGPFPPDHPKGHRR